MWIQYTADGRRINLRYIDLDGHPVERTRDEYRYSYDPYVLWKGDYKKGQSDTVYSDRLSQWDFDKYKKCIKTIWRNESDYFNDRTPESIEKFLSLYFGYEVKLTAVMEGCNISTGYPYWIFYFERK